MEPSTNRSELRRDFPLLEREVAGRPITYFDNAATSLKPRAVITAMDEYYQRSCANIHRGKHLISEEASIAFEEARQKVARFISSAVPDVILVGGTTAGINLVADGLGLAADDNVVATVLEHHSNILPWSSRCELRLAPLDATGLPDMEAAASLIDGRTRIIAVTWCSNVTGAVVPVERWSELAHDHNLPLLVDGAQGVAHTAVDVGQLDCDFLVFSGHKLCGPSGTGVLYGKAQRLEELQPRSLGGGAVSEVAADGSYSLRRIPWRFEGGTPNIAGVIGLGAAIDYLSGIGTATIEERNRTLRQALLSAVTGIEGIRVHHAPADMQAAPILAMTLEGSACGSPDWVSRVLSDTFGIMTRGGHHCCHPLHLHLGIDGSLRASLQFYNTVEEIDHLRDAMAIVAGMV